MTNQEVIALFTKIYNEHHVVANGECSCGWTHDLRKGRKTSEIHRLHKRHQLSMLELELNENSSNN